MTHLFPRTVRMSESNYMLNTSNNSKAIQNIKFCMLILWLNKTFSVNFLDQVCNFFVKIDTNFVK